MKKKIVYISLFIALIINLVKMIFGHHNRSLTTITTLALLYLVFYENGKEE